MHLEPSSPDSSPPDPAANEDRIICTAEDLTTALVDTFLANAEKGHNAANDALIQQLARRQRQNRPSNDLPRRPPGKPTIPAAPPSMRIERDPDLLRRVRDGLVRLPLSTEEAHL